MRTVGTIRTADSIVAVPIAAVPVAAVPTETVALRAVTTPATRALLTLLALLPGVLLSNVLLLLAPLATVLMFPALLGRLLDIARSSAVRSGSRRRKSLADRGSGHGHYL